MICTFNYDILHCCSGCDILMLYSDMRLDILSDFGFVTLSLDQIYKLTQSWWSTSFKFLDVKTFSTFTFCWKEPEQSSFTKIQPIPVNSIKIAANQSSFVQISTNKLFLHVWMTDCAFNEREVELTVLSCSPAALEVKDLKCKIENCKDKLLMDMNSTSCFSITII